jgi:2-dehydro-3-deoxygluconokinase
MLELRRVDAETMRLSHAGDSYNAAVYLRRVAAELGLDVEVGYLTGVGEDAQSAEMRAAWRDEAIADRAIAVPDKVPGLYIVATDAAGERSFTYWRSDSAARRLLAGRDWIAAVDADVVHLSGISLQLMTDASRGALLARLEELRGRGARIAFDTNYRAAGWPSVSAARAAIDALARRADMVFTSLEDELALHGPTSAEQAVERRAAGATEVVVKAGADGAWLWSAESGATTHLPAVPPNRVVDTTAAGDALAGAFVAARLACRAPRAALELGMRAAAVVIAYPGALTPRDVTLVDS